MKRKYVFSGDLKSINIELILKSHKYLKDKVKYIIIGNLKDIKKYTLRTKYRYNFNSIYDPINFTDFKKNFLNIYNIDNAKSKTESLLNQINISNNLSSITNYDLVTMPINKSLFKSKLEFIGMTEYLGYLNKRNTFMLMKGENFSVIPLTTHINPKFVHKSIELKKLKTKLNQIFSIIKKKLYDIKISDVKFLCYNPHCGENNYLGNEDKIIRKVIKKYKIISGVYPADSAFQNIKKNTIYLGYYHDQVLIPFKILNQKSFNLTLGLEYKRLSPAHGTATDIIFKNIADNTSYIECMTN